MTTNIGLLGILPFVLYFDRENPWLDVPTLLLEWLEISQIRSGYIFRPFNAYDQPVTKKNVTLVSISPAKRITAHIPTKILQQQGVFLADFRTNLAEIDLDPLLFGGHSFRRGGVQYFSDILRWPLRKLCSWGGWSLDFDNFTIIRYLLGKNDEPLYSREQFLDPEPKLGTKCTGCGRECDCAGRL